MQGDDACFVPSEVAVGTLSPHELWPHTSMDVQASLSTGEEGVGRSQGVTVPSTPHPARGNGGSLRGLASCSATTPTCPQLSSPPPGSQLPCCEAQLPTVQP